MKNLTKIFMAVAVAMFAFACVTDTTEDLGIKVEGQGVTELALSLEESRTHLGEKAEGVYPLYWSEGDAIAVNGVVSNPLTAGGEATAVFKFNEEVTAPLCVVYPASAAATVEEGGEAAPEPEPAPVTAYPVNFLAVQPYTVGTFAPQAAPMYGYAAELPETGVQLNHLTGVLRLAIAGNGEKVTSIVVKAQKGKIAGAYTVDCTTGVLTPSAEAVSSLTVTFAEPLVLGAEATPVYVAVPAGNYGTFAITINTEAHQKMTVKFNSDKKPINVGVVREFSAFVYEANANDAEDTFIIDSKEALIEFAKIAGTFYPRTNAVVTADIDMTGYDWTPIANFGEFEFDGGDCTISGLNAPLFASTAANIHDLKLTNVNYTVTDLAHSGAIACELYNGSLSNCSVAGTVNINNTTLAEAASSYAGIGHAGLVGFASAATFTNCTNDIDITISSLCEESKSITSTVGGVVGCVTDGCALTYITNNGDITYAGTTQKANCYISGVVGKNSDVADNGVADFVSLSNCTNNGKISSTAGCKSTGNLLMSGITGRVMIDVNTVCNLLVNNGTITHNGTCVSATIGGIAAYDSQGTFTNCSNTAALSIADGSSVSGSSTVCGLFAGTVTTGGINNCHNTGGISINGGKVVATGKVYMAGVANVITTSGDILPEITNCTNSASISLVGWSSASESKNGGRAFVGGVFQSVNAGKYSKCYNQATGTITINTGAMTSAEEASACMQLIGGFTAYISSRAANPVLYISECENRANMTVSSTGTVRNAEIGGFVGEAYVNNHNDALSLDMKNCKNSGNITVSATYVGSPQIGGLYGINNYDTIVLTSCENSGNVTFNGTAPYVHLGGLLGYDGSNYALTIDSCVNKGAVKCTSVMTGGVRIGGIVGTYNKDYESATIVKNCTNLGTVALEGVQTVSEASYRYIVGGIVGYCADTLLSIEDCVNGSATDATKGVVTVGTAPSGVGLGGILGLADKAITVSGCINYGTVTQTGKGGKNDVYRPHLGGIVGINSAGYITITECKNYGTVCYGTVQAANKADVAGIIGETCSTGGLIENCENGGTIKITAPTSSETNLAGIIGMGQTSTTIKNCKNLATAVISFEGNHTGGAMCIGGIAGSTNSGSAKLLYCYNYGTIQQTKANTKGNLYIGGLNGYPYILGTMQYCGNHGPVIANGANNICIGGLVGYPRTGTSGNQFLDCYNAYDLVFTGKATANYYAGGVCGVYGKNKDVVPTIKNLVNLGNLTFKGTGATEKLGGIIGQSSNGVIESCVCYADLKAIGKEGKVGAIMGMGRTEATKASNCKIGGNMVFSETVEEVEDPEGGEPQVTVTNINTPIDASSYFKYIYTSAITEDQATEDGCEALATKPAVPVYTPAE